MEQSMSSSRVCFLYVKVSVLHVKGSTVKLATCNVHNFQNKACWEIFYLFELLLKLWYGHGLGTERQWFGLSTYYVTSWLTENLVGFSLLGLRKTMC